MGFLDSGGQGANAFVDSFLKTYMMIDESKRAKASQELAKQMAQAKLQEIEREKQYEIAKRQKEAENGGQLSPDETVRLGLNYAGVKDVPQYAQAMAPKETPADRLLKTGRYDPKSIMEYVKTGDMSVLQPLDKQPTTDLGLVSADLESRLGRKPTPREILEEKAKYGAKVAGDKAGATETAKNEANKGLITDDVITDWARYVATKGEFPPESTRFFRNAGAQADINNRVLAKLKEWDVDGADRAVQGASFKSNQSALTFQEKQRGSAQSFVYNLDGQISKVDSIMKDVIDRVGVRAIDMPLVQLKKQFVGSGHERVLESYLMEISREIGKLSTGSQASVAELSVEAQKKWDKIHDPNLSLGELSKILTATKDQAHIRVKSMDDAILDTKKRLSPSSEGKKQLLDKSNVPEFKITLKPGENEEQVMKTISTIPKGAVQKLIANPSLATQFELKYGKGTSNWFLGAKNEKRF